MDDASFKTSILCISDGAMSLILETGKPSTIYKGELSWDKEPPPRTRIFTSASGAPSVVVILTPASFPVRASVALDTGTTARSLELTEATDPVKSLLLTVP